MTLRSYHFTLFIKLLARQEYDIKYVCYNKSQNNFLFI
jgi:hypothetical protein